MIYRQIRECDSFYELSAAGLNSLPHAIRNLLNQRRPSAESADHEPTSKRVTHSRRSSKSPQAGLDLYSPNAEFDYRVSINLEVNLKGNWRDLVVPTTLNVKSSERGHPLAASLQEY